MDARVPRPCANCQDDAVITPLRATARRIVEALPEPLSLALRPRRFRYPLEDRPRALPLRDAPVRLVIGNANFAAQGFHFARAAERLEGVSAANVHLLGPTKMYGFPADYTVPASVYQHSSHWRREHFQEVRARATHVIIESGIPWFGSLFENDVVAEISALRTAGVSVALLAHGSELRLPSRHVQIDEWSPYAAGRWPDTELLEEGAWRFREILRATEVPLFVTTQEMLLDWPEATWLPLAVPSERWASDVPVLERKRPVVVHAPTNPYLKNTALVEPALHRLDQEGVIEYRRLPMVTTDEMPGLIAQADVVLDQFGAGCYSVASVEAMAAGRVTVAHVHEQVRQTVRDRLGLEVPVVSAHPGNLEAVLRNMVVDPAPFREIAARGPAFARAAHDGTASSRALSSFLLG